MIGNMAYTNGYCIPNIYCEDEDRDFSCEDKDVLGCKEIPDACPHTYTCASL